MLKEFNRLANLWNWNLNRCETLLAVSGGADSVVLARFFKELNFPFAIAHVNYGLRGEDSIQDQRLVENLAAELGVECFVHQSSPEALAMSQGISLQMSARHTRYAFFEKIMARFPGRFAKIATAHHGNDNLEHFFLYLYRGNYRVAWRGIPVENGDIIRPLLGYSKEKIYEIAIEHGWHWREDASNQKPTYLRNKIRHWIIPALHDSLDFVHEFYELSVQQQRLLADSKPKLLLEWERWVETDKENDSLWLPEHLGNRRWLEDMEMKNFAKEQLLSLGFTRDQIDKIVGFSVQTGGKILGKKYEAYRTRTGWKLFKELPKFTGGKLEILKVTKHDFDRWKSENTRVTTTNSVFVSPSIQGMNLKVGSRNEGDFFTSASGKKKLLSDVFIDLKIEDYLKDIYPVISNEMGEVIAVFGLVIGEKYRVKMEDSYCFRLDFIQN